ncbi:MAG TPA: hypothetical protein VGC09_02315 [Rhodopila sp.]
MKQILVAAGLVVIGAGAAITVGPSVAFAANAGDPYGNVDHRNDAGNDTGDSRVDGLNANQSNENYRGSVEPRAPSGTQMVAPTQPGMTAPQPGSPPGPPPGAPPSAMAR